jgi:hypothetical protein
MTPGKILAAESGVSVITLPQNQGKGAALRAGFCRGGKARLHPRHHD